MSDVLQEPDGRDQPDVQGVPDYELAESSVVDSAARLKAFADPTRKAIMNLLLERAASTSELAIALDRPKGTIDHHLKALAKADLVHVVRTRQVRAMTERFWGRTARTFRFTTIDGELPTALWFLRDAQEEIERSVQMPGHEDECFSTLRHARIPAARAEEFSARLNELALEFVNGERAGDTVFGLLIALFPTDQPILPDRSGPTDRDADGDDER